MLLCQGSRCNDGQFTGFFRGSIVGRYPTSYLLTQRVPRAKVSNIAGNTPELLVSHSVA